MSSPFGELWQVVMFIEWWHEFVYKAVVDSKNVGMFI